VPQISQQASNK